MKRRARSSRRLTPRLHVLLDVGPVSMPGGRLEGEDDAALAEAWWAYRDWLLDPKRNRPGRRPWGFWKFEVQDASMLDASEEHRLGFLQEHDLLRSDERAVLDLAHAVNGR